MHQMPEEVLDALKYIAMPSVGTGNLFIKFP